MQRRDVGIAVLRTGSHRPVKKMVAVGEKLRVQVRRFLSVLSGGHLNRHAACRRYALYSFGILSSKQDHTVSIPGAREVLPRSVAKRLHGSAVDIHLLQFIVGEKSNRLAVRGP